MSIFLVFIFVILLGRLFHSLGPVIRILFINYVEFENGILLEGLFLNLYLFSYFICTLDKFMN